MVYRSDFDDVGKLVLRLTIGGLMLLHGIHKLKYGIGGIERLVDSKGLPDVLAYGVHIGETLAPLAMILGVKTRIAAAVLALNMVVAVLLAHPSEIFALGKQGAWAIESAGMFLLGGVAIFLLGGGRLSLSRGRGRWD